MVLVAYKPHSAHAPRGQRLRLVGSPAAACKPVSLRTLLCAAHCRPSPCKVWAAAGAGACAPATTHPPWCSSRPRWPPHSSGASRGLAGRLVGASGLRAWGGCARSPRRQCRRVRSERPSRPTARRDASCRDASAGCARAGGAITAESPGSTSARRAGGPPL